MNTVFARRPVFLSGAVALCMVASPAWAQQNAPVDLGGAVPYQSDVPMGGAPLDAPLDDTSRLQNDVRDLTGQVERLQFELNQLKTSYEKQISDLQLRLTTLEGKGAAAAPAATPDAATPPPPAADTPSLVGTTPAPATPMPAPADPKAPADPASPTVQTMGAIQPKPEPGVLAGVPNDPAAAYEESFTALKNGDYAVAEQGFKGFLANYPKHALATNAKYWLGETYFARKDYTQSSRIFAEGYKAAPKGPKAADNLLKLGLSLAGQSKTKEACVALSQIGKDFPKGSSAVLTRADTEMKRLACTP